MAPKRDRIASHILFLGRDVKALKGPSIPTKGDVLSLYLNALAAEPDKPAKEIKRDAVRRCTAVWKSIGIPTGDHGYKNLNTLIGQFEKMKKAYRASNRIHRRVIIDTFRQKCNLVFPISSEKPENDSLDACTPIKRELIKKAKRDKINFSERAIRRKVQQLGDKLNVDENDNDLRLDVTDEMEPPRKRVKCNPPPAREDNDDNAAAGARGQKEKESIDEALTKSTKPSKSSSSAGSDDAERRLAELMKELEEHDKKFEALDKRLQSLDSKDEKHRSGVDATDEKNEPVIESQLNEGADLATANSTGSTIPAEKHEIPEHTDTRTPENQANSLDDPKKAAAIKAHASTSTADHEKQACSPDANRTAGETSIATETAKQAEWNTSPVREDEDDHQAEANDENRVESIDKAASGGTVSNVKKPSQSAGSSHPSSEAGLLQQWSPSGCDAEESQHEEVDTEGFENVASAEDADKRDSLDGTEAAEKVADSIAEISLSTALDEEKQAPSLDSETSPVRETSNATEPPKEAGPSTSSAEDDEGSCAAALSSCAGLTKQTEVNDKKVEALDKRLTLVGSEAEKHRGHSLDGAEAATKAAHSIAEISSSTADHEERQALSLDEASPVGRTTSPELLACRVTETSTETEADVDEESSGEASKVPGAPNSPGEEDDWQVIRNAREVFTHVEGEVEALNEQTWALVRQIERTLAAQLRETLNPVAASSAFSTRHAEKRRREANGEDYPEAAAKCPRLDLPEDGSPLVAKVAGCNESTYTDISSSSSSSSRNDTSSGDFSTDSLDVATSMSSMSSEEEEQA